MSALKNKLARLQARMSEAVSGAVGSETKIGAMGASPVLIQPRSGETINIGKATPHQVVSLVDEF